MLNLSFPRAGRCFPVIVFVGEPPGVRRLLGASIRASIRERVTVLAGGSWHDVPLQCGLHANPRGQTTHRPRACARESYGDSP